MWINWRSEKEIIKNNITSINYNKVKNRTWYPNWNHKNRRNQSSIKMQIITQNKNKRAPPGHSSNLHKIPRNPYKYISPNIEIDETR
jgi:hypothetical protein